MQACAQMQLGGVARPRARALAAKATIAHAPARAAAATAPARSRAAFVVRAAEDELDSEDYVKMLQEKWEMTENKSTIALYGAGVLGSVYIANSVVGFINAVPLLPKLVELVGLGYSSWFVYRYLLFKESRKELLADVDELKAKVSSFGSDE